MFFYYAEFSFYFLITVYIFNYRKMYKMKLYSQSVSAISFSKNVQQ